MKKQNFLWKDFRFSPLELISQLRILYFEFISGHFVTLRMFVNYPKKSGDESSNFTSQNEWVPFHSCFYRTWTSSSVTKSFAFVRVKTYFTNLCHFRTRSVDKAFAKWYATLTHFCYLFSIDLYTVQRTRTGTTHRYRLTLTCTPNHTATCTKHGTINVILSNAFTLDGSVFQRIIFRFPESFHRVNSSPFDFFECE